MSLLLVNDSTGRELHEALCVRMQKEDTDASSPVVLLSSTASVCRIRVFVFPH